MSTPNSDNSIKVAHIHGIWAVVGAVVGALAGVWGGSSWQERMAEKVYDDNTKLRNDITILNGENIKLTSERDTIINKLKKYESDYVNLDKKYKTLYLSFENIQHENIMLRQENAIRGNVDTKCNTPIEKFENSNETNNISEINKVYLTDIKEAYQHHNAHRRGDYLEFSEKKGTANNGFSMAGTTYFNGFIFKRPYDMGGRFVHFALFNLEKKYSLLKIKIGPLDNTNNNKVTLNIYGDHRLIKRIDMSNQFHPKDMDLKVQGIEQLKFEIDKFPKGGGYGFADPILK